MVVVYTYDNRPYLQLATWERHQQIRSKRSKYPAPEEGLSLPDARICKQMIADDCTCARNPIQSQSASNPNPDKGRGEGAAAALEVARLPLADQSEYALTDAQVAGWQALYPKVDIAQQLRSMRGWLLANPQRRKTRRGILRFVTGWLARQQDQADAPPRADGPRKQLDGNRYDQRSDSLEDIYTTPWAQQDAPGAADG
nr:hypothetical protein [Maliibacterium massiliense]